MQYRATRHNQPNKSDTLVRSREQAFKLIENLDKKLAGKLPAQERATFFCGRAVLYEALGDPKMLEASKEAYAFSKTAQSAALVAVALHHFGRLQEALDWYARSYKYPHEAGWEIDIGYSNSLLFTQTDESWLKAWKIVLGLKKRMVSAARLPLWDGRPVKNLQIISEGGFGDLIQNSRYLSKCTELAEHVTVFLPPFFFEHGFVDLAKRNSWWPETKLLTECKAEIPSAGFFDLPGIAQTVPSAVPPPVLWVTERRHSEVSARGDKPRVGFVWSARAMETPLVEDGIYRSLTMSQATRIVSSTQDKIQWVCLQKETGGVVPGVWTETPEIKSWDDTAAIINGLDAVITVDTAVAHLAASMNKPTWVILSGAVDWKFGIFGNTCVWYHQWRLFRNNEWGFDRAVDAVISDLKEGATF